MWGIAILAALHDAVSTNGDLEAACIAGQSVRWIAVLAWIDLQVAAHGWCVHSRVSSAGGAFAARAGGSTAAPLTAAAARATDAAGTAASAFAARATDASGTTATAFATYPARPTAASAAAASASASRVAGATVAIRQMSADATSAERFDEAKAAPMPGQELSAAAFRNRGAIAVKVRRLLAGRGPRATCAPERDPHRAQHKRPTARVLHDACLRFRLIRADCSRV